MKVVGGTDVEESRDDDEAEVRVLDMAKRGWGLEDMATDAERDVPWVIDVLTKHRDAFAAEHPN